MDLAVVDAVLSILGQHSISQLLVTVLLNSRYDGHPQKHNFIQQWPDLLAFLASHPALENLTDNFIFTKFKTTLTKEIKHMAEKENGWHVGAKHVRAEQLDAFNIDGMSSRLQEQAPVLSSLLATLLDSDPRRTLRQEESLTDGQSARPNLGEDEWNEEDEYWWAADLDMLGAQDGDGNTDGNWGGVEVESPQGEGEYGSTATAEDVRSEQLKKRQRNAIVRRQKLLTIVSSLTRPSGLL